MEVALAAGGPVCPRLFVPGLDRTRRVRSGATQSRLPLYGSVGLAEFFEERLNHFKPWIDEGMTPNTVRHRHSVLSAVLHQAAKWGLINSMVRNAPVRAAVDEAAQGFHARTDATTDHYSENRGQPVLAVCIATACTTAMRRGELLGRRWDDVDFEHRSLQVRWAVKHTMDRASRFGR